MNFILDPYILALPDSTTETLRLQDYAERLYMWTREVNRRNHKFWLSWAILDALYGSGLYPTYENLQNLTINAQFSAVHDAYTLFRATERELTEPPLLDDQIQDRDIAYELEQALVIPAAIESRLPDSVAQALRKTLILAALAARKGIDEVFGDLSFATAPNGFRESDLRLEFEAILPGLDDIIIIDDAWPMLTSPAQIDDLEGFTSFWEDTDRAMRWIHRQVFIANSSPPPYPKVRAHADFNQSVKKFQCHRKPAILTKVFRTIVMGLTGEISCYSKTHHPLTKGGEQVCIGEVTAWRLWIEHSNPGWRVHYWRYPDGSFELANLVVHDDLYISLPAQTL